MKKHIAAATAVLFFYTSILAPVVQASMPAPVATPAVPCSTEDLVPASIGSVTASRDFAGGRTVILIQDLHCHPEVQKNTSAIIGTLDKKYALDRVYVEGASGDVDTSCVTQLSGAGLAAPVAQALLDAGRLTGGEYYSITANKPHLLKGLEDSRLHEENIVRLGSLLAQKKAWTASAGLLDKDLALLKTRYLTRRNKKLNEIIAGYESGSIPARKYYAILQKYAALVNRRPDSFNAMMTIRMDRYPNMAAYRELMALGQRLNHARIKRQLGTFLGELKSVLPYSEYNKLLQATDQFSDADKVVAALSALAAERRISLLPRYPDLAVFLRYHERSRAINPVELIREEQRLVSELRIAFSRDVSEVEVSFLCDFHDVFKDYLFNRLSAADYGYFVSRFEKFKTLWAKYNYTNHLTDLAPAFPLLDAYYAVNNRRSVAFVARALSDPAAPSIIVMVTGGFHAEDIQKLLEERRISYRTVTPRIHTDTAGAGIAYESIIREQADLFSRNALSYRLFMQMGAKLLPTDDKGYALQFNTGEYVEVSGDGKHITLKMVPGNEIMPRKGATWQSLTEAATYAATSAADMARSHLGLFETILSGPDIVPFTGMLYFLARKGWLPGDGLSIVIDQSDPDVIAAVLEKLAEEIDKKTADLNDLAILPEVAQISILDHVKAMRGVDRSTPAYIRAVEGLYELLIKLNRIPADKQTVESTPPSPSQRPMAPAEPEFARDNPWLLVRAAIDVDLSEEVVEHVKQIEKSMRNELEQAQNNPRGPEVLRQIDAEIFVKRAGNSTTIAGEAASGRTDLESERLFREADEQVKEWVNEKTNISIDLLIQLNTMLRPRDTKEELSGVRHDWDGYIPTDAGYKFFVPGLHVQAALQDVIDWYNQNQDKSAIELAVKMRRKLFSIHPFVDGNGRTADLLMNWILREHGLPAVFIDTKRYDYAVFREDIVRRFQNRMLQVPANVAPVLLGSEEFTFADGKNEEIRDYYVERNNELITALSDAIQKYAEELNQLLKWGDAEPYVQHDNPDVFNYDKDGRYLGVLPNSNNEEVDHFLFRLFLDASVFSALIMAGKEDIYLEVQKKMSDNISSGRDKFFQLPELLIKLMGAHRPFKNLRTEQIQHLIETIDNEENPHKATDVDKHLRHERFLGVGSAGVAILVTDTRDGKKKVLKVPRSSGTGFERLQNGIDEILLSEIQKFEDLKGVRGLVSVHEFYNAHKAILMEYISGYTLDKHDAELSSNSFNTLREFAQEVATRGYLIADLHGANVMVNDAGDITILDVSFYEYRPELSRAEVVAFNLEQVENMLEDLPRRSSTPSPGFGLAMGASVRAAIESRPRWLKWHNGMPRPVQAAIEALAAIFLVPVGVEKGMITAMYEARRNADGTFEALRYTFLAGHEDGRTSEFGKRMRSKGLDSILLAMRLAAPFGPKAVEWANILTHMLYNVIAVPAGAVLARDDRGVYVPTVVRPDPASPLVDLVPLPDVNYSSSYFAAPGTRKLIADLAELMDDRVRIVFADGPVGENGFGIVNHEPQEIPSSVYETPPDGWGPNVRVGMTITVHKDITFTQLIGLVTELYRGMLADSEGKTAQYRRLLLSRIAAAEDMRNNLINAAEYLGDIRRSWIRDLDLDPAQAAEFTRSIDSMISGFRTLAQQETIRSPGIFDDLVRTVRVFIDSVADRKRQAAAESWLGINKGWKDAVRNMPRDDRAQAVKVLQDRWTRLVAYEINGPARALDEAIVEMGGRRLETIRSKSSGYNTLLEEIDAETAGLEPLSEKDAAKIISIVQEKVRRYSDRLRNSSTPAVAMHPELKDLADALGIDQQILAMRREISPSVITDSLHMVCVMQSFLCGRILRDKGFAVYWLNVQETVNNDQDVHEAVLVRLPGGLYQIVDSANPAGAGAVPGKYLAPGEVERLLAGSRAVSVTLDPDSKTLHHRIEILDFDAGALAGIFIDYFVTSNDHDLDTAILKKVFERMPRMVSAWHSLGLSLHFAGDHAGSVRALQEAVRLNPSNTVILFHLGAALYLSKDLAGAVQVFDTVLERNPQHGEARAMRSLALGAQTLKAGFELSRNDDHDRALAVFEAATEHLQNAVKLAPSADEAWHYLGLSLYYRGAYADAIEALRKAIELSPDNVRAQFLLAKALQRAGRNSEAKDAFEVLFKYEEYMVPAIGRWGNISTPPAILPVNTGPYVLTVGILRQFMPVRWAQVISLAIVHTKEYSYLKPLMDDRVSNKKAQQIADDFDKLHGTANPTRKAAILAMGEAGRRASSNFDCFGLGRLAAFIASGIVHVKYDMAASLPLAFLVSENGDDVEDARKLAVKNGFVPVIVRPLPLDLAGKPPRSAGIKNVWARVEDNSTLVMYIKAPSGELHRMVADVISTLRGNAHVRGASLPMRVLSAESHQKLDGEKIVMHDATKAGVSSPLWQDVLMLTDNSLWGPWEAMANAHRADTVARAPEMGIELEWSEKLGQELIAKGHLLNQSLFFSVNTFEQLAQLTEKNELGVSPLELLQSRGAKVYAIYDGENGIPFCKTLIKKRESDGREFNGIVCTNPKLDVSEIAKDPDIENHDVVIAGSKQGSVRSFVNVYLDDPETVRQLPAVKPGSVIRVHLRETGNPSERIALLNALPSSCIVVFSGEEIQEDGSIRDTTQLSIAGVNIFDILRLTPRSPDELVSHQRRVAEELTIDACEQYDTAAEAEREISQLAAGNFSAVTKNTQFVEAVRLHARRVKDATLRQEFLNAVAARMHALQVLAKAGKSAGLTDRRLERILAEMIPLAHNDMPDPTVMDHVAALQPKINPGNDNDPTIKDLQQLQFFQEQLFMEITSLRRKASSDPMAASTVIELIKLYADQRLQISISAKDMTLTGTAAAKAILEAA